MDREYVMAVVGLAGEVTAGTFRPGWLREYDPESHNGRGDAVVTRDLAKAKRFADQGEAVRLRQLVPKAKPTRADGEPNRPLTAFTVEVLPIDLEDPDRWEVAE